MAVHVAYTKKNTAANKLKLDSCTILSINGNEINDMLDYEFYTKSKEMQICVIRENKQETLIVEKQEYEPFGCEFDTFLIDEKHMCKNKCVFCFVDQIPKGLRSDLYFKDDDERLSFLYGNYITLTNLNKSEIDRIIKMNISPMNISVHTVDCDLRVQMMKNPNAGKVLAYIDDFNEAGIKMNFQLVLCPGINDGEKLAQSLEKLAAYYPNVQSIAAVPVGLTKYRQNLAPLKVYNEKSAKEQLEIMLKYGEKFKKEYGSRIIYPADEWFILAKKPLPDYDFYEDFVQLENGVGMWRNFYSEFINELQYIKPPMFTKKFDVVTGEITKDLAKELCDELCARVPKVKIKLHVVKNEFFGGNVCVTGLLTGEDIIKTLKGKMFSKTLLLPENILRDENDVLLDNTSLKQLSDELGVKVKILPQNGANAAMVMLGKG